MKHTLILLAMILLSFTNVSCSEWFMENPVYHTHVNYDNDTSEIIIVDSQEEYEKLCIRTEYYFCPGVSGPLMRIEITKDVCVDPPIVLSMSECKEFLECDPHHYNLGEKPCVTEDGNEGFYTTYCVKGYLEEGLCKGSFTQGEREEKDVKDIAAEQPEDALSDPEEDSSISVYDECEKEDVDVLIILDLSASMLPEIESVYALASAFSEKYKESSHVKWALIVGPKNAGDTPGNHNFLYLASNLQAIGEFQDVLGDVTTYDMIGQYEMLYDALYLSLRNISAFLPYQWEELLWPVWVGNVIDESDPPLDEFYVDWRANSKKIVIVFTDEPGQSFLIPASKVGKSYNTNSTITQEKLLMMLESIDDIKLYAFIDNMSKDITGGWEPLADATSGMTFDLNGKPENTFGYLEDVMSSEICF